MITIFGIFRGEKWQFAHFLKTGFPTTNFTGQRIKRRIGSNFASMYASGATRLLLV
jgi:hypothetical protein